VESLIHYLQIIALGIVEGVTEFLPISSTGHLLIAEHLMGTKEPDIFNVVIQAGAILAVVFIYWPTIAGLIADLERPAARNYLLKIGLAFITTTILILLLTVKLKLKLPESLVPVAWATFIGGFVIFAIEFFAKGLYAHEDVSWFEAVLVGAGQVVAAIFPGASRSGSTIMAGLAVGMKRPSVTQFSFLVGIPTMFAASAYATLKDRNDLHGISHQLVIDTAIGFVVSMIVAFFVVKWLLRFVQSHTFNGFAIYRVILGGALLVGLYTHAIPDISNEKPAPAKAPFIAPVPSGNAPVPDATAAPTTNTDSSATPTTNGPVTTTNSAPATDASTNSAPTASTEASSTTTNAAPATNVPAPQ
jgi:undecaprenyl-diphosphatase